MGNQVLHKISGWGRYPVIKARKVTYRTDDELKQGLLQVNDCIARGNARSYGDSSLSGTYVSLLQKNRILSFDEVKGIIKCESGVLLSEIIEVFLPKGWFLKVTPGTKLITVGGAIASDVHGKNHHIEGCFGETVESILLMLPDGECVSCSRTENRELFLATCGGMGLTGIILEASFYLKQVNSQVISQTTIKTKNLKETFDAFERYADKEYSVAWIDCLAELNNTGRSLLMVGEFSDDGNLSYVQGKKISIPFDFPSMALNHFSVKAFNALYYAKASSSISHQVVSLDSFFYPLDSINQWNRIYGKNGFIQYQFILPKDQSYKGLKLILSKIAESGMGSFLAVLKLYGPQNEHYLSFPLEGYSLALDFKMQQGLMVFLQTLDQIVLSFGGRIYLSKDARVDKSTFEQGYPHIEKFRELRHCLGLKEKFTSLQSKRLDI